MGIGAFLDRRLIPTSQVNQFNNPVPGPNAVILRMRKGLSQRAAQANLAAVSTALSNPANFGAYFVSVLRPAEIVNYKSMGNTPALLGSALAAGAVVALGLTLLASVRRRRRDLAVLKTLGFIRRQMAGAVVWQSLIAVALGTAVGVPLGIAVGRQLWILFANEIHAVPEPTVPAITVLLVAIGALILAAVVAIPSGLIAARTQPTHILREP
jgi:ABC-type antimicrobial peptide transport system permease subunit